MYYTIFATTFTITSFACAFIDFNLPKLRKTTKKNEDINADYKKLLPVVIDNFFLSLPVFYYFENHLFQIKEVKENIFNYHWSVYILSWMILSDFFFYIVHRILHTPRFYYLHKAHHEFNNPYGIGAIYCSKFEMVSANLTAMMLPIYFLKIPEILVYRMIGIMTFWTVFMSHSNLQDWNNSHVIHHRKLKCNYGLFIMDRIMGTKEKKM